MIQLAMAVGAGEGEVMNYKPDDCYSFRFGVYFLRVGGCEPDTHPQR